MFFALLPFDARRAVPLINENCHCLESAKKLVLLKYNVVNVLFALKDLQNGQMLLFDILM